MGFANEMKTNRSIRCAVAGTLALLAAVAAGPALAQGGPGGAPVRVAVAERKAISPTVWVAGTVVGRDDARLAAEVGGRLIWVAEVGDPLAAGDGVARLDDTELRIQVSEAQAVAARDKARLAFLEQELNNVKTRIDTLENNLSRFKQAHAGELPDNKVLNIQAITRMDRDLDQINTQLRSLKERKIYLKGQLAVVEPFDKLDEEDDLMLQRRMHLEARRLELIGLQTTLSEKHPDIKRLKSEIRELEAQVGQEENPAARARAIDAMQKELAELKGRLGPKHPDVLSLSKKVAALREEMDKSEAERPGAEDVRETSDNPAYINLMTQIATTDMELKSLMEEKQGLKKRVDVYQKRLEKGPAVEKEYLNLTRNHENAKEIYNDISQKLMEARLAQGMEEAQKGERFTITDPAQLPERPYKPNRKAIILIGFVLALGAGVGVGAIGESLDSSVKTSDELRRLTGAPVFSVIPLMETDRERRIRWLKRGIWFVIVLVAIGMALALVDRYVMPLDILWIKIQRRVMMAFPLVG